MREFLSKYSDRYDNLNEDIIVNIRKNDSIVEKIEEICIELAKSLSKYVVYLGFDWDDAKARFKEVNSTSKKRDSKTGKLENVRYINLNRTYSRLAVFHFRIKYEDPRTKEVSINKVDMPMYIPIIYDNYHYLIRGNKWSCPYQLTDALTYLGKGNSIILRTLTRAIKLSREASVITDAHGLDYKTFTFYTYVSNKKIPFLLYYFAYYGFFHTLEFFGVKDTVKLYNDCPLEPDSDVIYFKFGQLYLGVDRDEFNRVYELRQLVSTILALGRKNLILQQIRDAYYWRMTLGTYVSLTKSYDQGAALLTTFACCADARTKYNIATIAGGSPKTNSFTILRWMFLNYSQLSNKNASIYNKRLRYAEYLVAPVTRECQTRLYRFLKTRPNMRDKKRLIDVFKPSPSLLCNAIIGKVKKKSQMLNVAKYSNQVNDLVLLSTALKWTASGPGSATEYSGHRVSAHFRNYAPNYVGKVDVLATPNGSVGLSGNLSPWVQVDTNNLTFINPAASKQYEQKRRGVAV